MSKELHLTWWVMLYDLISNILVCHFLNFILYWSLLPTSWLSVHQCQTEIRIHSYGGEIKSGFITLPNKGGTQQASSLKIVLPSPMSRKKLYSQTEACDKDQGSNSLVFFLLQSFKRMGLLTGLWCVKSVRWLGLLTLMRFSGPFNLVSGGVHDCSYLDQQLFCLLELREGHEDWSFTCKKWGTKSSLGLGVPQGPAWHHWVGRSPGEGNGNPLQYFCLDDSMDRGAWWATHEVAKSQTRLSN